MYGFTVNTDGNSIAVMKQIEEQMRRMGVQYQTTTKEMKSTSSELIEMFKEVETAIIGAFAIERLKEYATEIVHITAEFEGFDNVIKYSSLGILDAADNLNYVNDAVDRLHLPIKETNESFSEMQAGFVGTGIEGERLRKVFEGIADASSVLHLNPATFSRVTFALKEIGELGTLQMRQMRMLAFAMPGAMSEAAKAMHMSSQQFHEAMGKGEIKSNDFLPKFADELTKHFSAGLGNAGNSLISQLNDEKTAITRTMLELGEDLRPLIVNVLKDIIAGAKEFQAIWVSLSGNGNFIKMLESLLSIALKLIPIWLTYKAVMFVVSAVTTAVTIKNGILTASMGELTVMTDGSTVAFEGFSAALSTLATGGIVVALGLMVEQIIAMNNEIDETVNKITDIDKIRKIIADQGKINITIGEKYNNLGQLSGEEKNQLAYDIQEQIKRLQDDLGKTVQPQVAITDNARRSAESAVKVLDTSKMNTPTVGGAMPDFLGIDKFLTGKMASKEAMGYNSSLKETREATDKLKNSIGDLQVKLAVLKNQGIVPKALTYKSKEGGTGAQDNASSTSELAGAKGGLGEAKVINIHIDTVQKINGILPEGIKDKAQSAIDVLIRTINNMAYSQSSTM